MPADVLSQYQAVTLASAPLCSALGAKLFGFTCKFNEVASWPASKGPQFVRRQRKGELHLVSVVVFYDLQWGFYLCMFVSFHTSTQISPPHLGLLLVKMLPSLDVGDIPEVRLTKCCFK